jgi:Icc-related predicted phosphoesterase
MKILFISDSHTFHKEIPKEWLVEADAICISGDICLEGSHHEALNFFEWLDSLSYKHKIFTVGNHDICFDEAHPRFSRFKNNHEKYKGEAIDDIRSKIPEGIHFLENSGVELDGLKFWGFPQTPEFYSWAFNVPRGEEIAKYTDQVPEDTDILLTHGPPNEILDMTMEGVYAGCEELAKRVKIVKPLVHSFGHIHEARGSDEQDGTLFLNSSVVNVRYYMVNRPYLVDIDENKVVRLL